MKSPLGRWASDVFCVKRSAFINVNPWLLDGDPAPGVCGKETLFHWKDGWSLRTHLHNPSNGWILWLVHVSALFKWEEHKFILSTRTVFSATRFEKQRVERLDEFFSGLPSHCFDLFPLVACREKNRGLEYSLNTPGPIFGWHPANDLGINGSDAIPLTSANLGWLFATSWCSVAFQDFWHIYKDTRDMSHDKL